MEKQKKSVSEGLLTESDYLKLLDIKILILSRGRSGNVTTHKLLPEYIEILVPESERLSYESDYANPIITIPDDEKGLGMVRNWVLDHFSENTIIMMDDDISYFYCLTEEKTRQIDDPEEMLQVLMNTAVMANDAGVCCFGYKQADIRKYNGCEPFNLVGWCGGIIGIIGRKYRFRDDKYKVDIDYCLQTLMNERIIWMDARYTASQKRDNNIGGNALFRTKEDFNRSIETLKEKWKGSIIVTYKKTQVSIRIAFKRKGIIKL